MSLYIEHDYGFEPLDNWPDDEYDEEYDEEYSAQDEALDEMAREEREW